MTQSLPKRFLVFILLYCYLLFNVLFRWYHWSLFGGDYRWGEQNIFALSIIITNLVLQYFVVLFILYLCLRWLSKRFVSILLLAFSWCFFVFIELDLSWYAVSKSHVGIADLSALITEDWQSHFGFNQGQILATLKPLVLHCSAVVLIYLIAYKLASKQFLLPLTQFYLKAKQLNPLYLLVPSLALIIAMSFYGVRLAPEQWQATFNKNILRDWSINQLFIANKYADIQQYSQRYAAAQKNYSFAQLNAEIGQDITSQKDVLVIMVEGFNTNYMDEQTTPYFYQLSKQGLYYQNHFSTGNSTSNGALGLLFGMPTFFYNRVNIQSRYLELFNRQGYNTQWYGKQVLEHNMAAYFEAFKVKPERKLKSVEITQDIQQALSQVQPHFIFTYYRETHWPYLHDADYSKFTPTVPDDFLFSDKELSLYRNEIINKYRNTLYQFDHWLKGLLAGIDLANTVVVIAGDHGEEMFETGRLSHSSTLNTPMTKTPALILAPGLSHQKIASISSHANLLPTIVQLLGVDTSDGAEFAFPAILSEKTNNIAIAAKNSQAFVVDSWVVIADDMKVFAQNNSDDKVDVVKVSHIENHQQTIANKQVIQSEALMKGLDMLWDLTTSANK